jgi:hypothetical protein
LRARPKNWNKLTLFEQALFDLPDKADPDVEIEWIASHPAMTKKSRSDNPMFSYKPDYTDIMVSHGPAPSKQAVNQLSHWANNPKDFIELVTKSQIKKSEKRAVEAIDPEGLEDDPSIKEVEKMIKDLRKSMEVEKQKLNGE